MLDPCLLRLGDGEEASARDLVPATESKDVYNLLLLHSEVDFS